MKGRFPRTAAEFQDHSRRVVANCTACWEVGYVEPEALIQMLGREGDVYLSFGELMGKLTCHSCEAPISRITVVNLNDKPFQDVSFEAALTRDLEFRAFCKARDEASWKDPRMPTGPRKARRVRKFGRR